MDIEREMRAVESQVVLESALQETPAAAGERLQSRPEQAVMDNEKIDPLLDRRINRPGRGIDRGPNFRHVARVPDLETIQRIRPVLDLIHPEEIATIFHYLGQDRHRGVLSTQRVRA